MEKSTGFFDLTIVGLFLSLFNFKLWGGAISWWIVVAPFGVYAVLFFIVLTVLGIAAVVTRND